MLMRRSLFVAIFFFLLWATWLALHAMFCYHLLFDVDNHAGFLSYLGVDTETHDRSFPLSIATLVVINALVLFRIIHLKTSFKSSGQNIGGRGSSAGGQLDLIGGFVISIIPLGLAALSFATSLAAPRETLFNPTTRNVDLERYNNEIPGAISFFVGLDVSKSVLHEDGKSAEQICEILRTMLLKDPSLPWNSPVSFPNRTLRAGIPLDELTGRIEFWEIATEVKEIEGINRIERLGDPAWEDLPNILCDRVENSYVDTNDTDIIGFLKKIDDRAIEALSENERVILILISDLVQDRKNETAEHVREQFREVANRLLRQADKTGRNGCSTSGSEIHCSRFTFIGLRAPNQMALNELAITAKHTLSTRQPVDLRPHLKRWFSDYWKEFGLEELFKSSSDQLLLTGATSTEIRVDVRETIYLKYEPIGELDDNKDDWKTATVINILNRNEVNSGKRHDLFFSLRSRPDHGTLPGHLQIRYQLDDGLRLPLSLIEDKKSDWEKETVAAGSEGKLQLWLESQVDVSRSARLELLIAVPERGVIYAIPALIVPTPGREAIWVFKFVVLFLTFCVLVFCVSMSRSWLRENRPWEWPFAKYVKFCIFRSAGLVESTAGRVKKHFEEPT